jgi:hypothetical protein
MGSRCLRRSVHRGQDVASVGSSALSKITADQVKDFALFIGAKYDDALTIARIFTRAGGSFENINSVILAFVTFLNLPAGSSRDIGLSEMGLVYEDLMAKTFLEVFLTLTDKIGAIPDEMERNILATEIFGRHGQLIVGALNQSNGSFRTMAATF